MVAIYTRALNNNNNKNNYNKIKTGNKYNSKNKNLVNKTLRKILPKQKIKKKNKPTKNYVKIFVERKNMRKVS